MSIINNLFKKKVIADLLKNKDFSADPESDGAIRESGRTMTEMLAVLGVLGIIAGGGTYGFAYAIDVFKSWSTQTQIANFSKGIEDLYGWRSDYNDVSMTGNGGICNNARDILQQACEGDVFKSNWGGSLYAQSAAGGKGYKIILTDVPVRACKILADMHWERVRLSDTSCNANRQTLTFVSYVKDECVPECTGNQTCEGGVCVCANGGIGESCDIVDPCETMNCEGVCRTGDCLNGRCETVANGTSCTGGRCFDGECVVCISSDDCPECQACVGNMCRNRADGTECSEGVCQNGVCGSADLCADVTCEECNTCNPDTGACEAVADGTSCGTNGVCTSGVCDLCANVTCEEVCAACNPSTGVCEAASDGTACGEDRTCSDGVCEGSCSANDECGINGYCADALYCDTWRSGTCTKMAEVTSVLITLSNGTQEKWYASNTYLNWGNAKRFCERLGKKMMIIRDLVSDWDGSEGIHILTERGEKLAQALNGKRSWADYLISNRMLSCMTYSLRLSDGDVSYESIGTSERIALCHEPCFNECTADYSCVDDVCVCENGGTGEDCIELCADVTCGVCQECNKKTGLCENVPDGTTPRQETADNGFPLPPPGMYCKKGQPSFSGNQQI